MSIIERCATVNDTSVLYRDHCTIQPLNTLQGQCIFLKGMFRKGTHFKYKGGTPAWLLKYIWWCGEKPLLCAYYRALYK